MHETTIEILNLINHKQDLKLKYSMFIHQSHFQRYHFKHELHQFNFYMLYNTLLSNYGVTQKLIIKIEKNIYKHD